MPSTRSAFREALYKAKSPLSIYNQEVPFDGDKLCGYCGVIREGLCHMAIPRGWMWGGPASEHYPIWVDVYTASDRSAIRQTTASADMNLSNSTIVDNAENHVRATDGMRRRTLRRNSLTSCRSLKMPSPVNGGPVDGNAVTSTPIVPTSSGRFKLERGNTIPTMTSGRSNGDGNSVFYDASDSCDANQSNSSSASSVNHAMNLSNGKCS